MKPSHEARAHRTKRLLMALIKGATTGDIANAVMIDKQEVGRYIGRLQKRTGIKLRKTCEERKMIYFLDMPLDEAVQLCYNADVKSFSKIAQQPCDPEPEGNIVDAPGQKSKKKKEIVPARETPWWGFINKHAGIEFRITAR